MAEAAARSDAEVTAARRQELEGVHGTVYNTDEMTAAFDVIGFAAPWVVVIRRSDGVKGTLEFTHMPRFYFSFKEDR